MANKSKIEWTDATWNPVTGCTKISVGCENCYAERMTKRFWREWDCLAPPQHFGVKWHPNRLEQPFHWRKPRRVFVCSMGDLFHESVPFEFIDKVFAVAALCPQHTFQVLTKRIKRAMEYFEYQRLHCSIAGAASKRSGIVALGVIDPLPNVWLGVTAENNDTLWRIDELVKIQAAVWFVSLEPLLKNIQIIRQLAICHISNPHKSLINWVIIGCESGPNRRPCDPDWVRDIVQQCKAASVPVFVKQLSINGKVSKDMSEWPEDLRFREYPG